MPRAFRFRLENLLRYRQLVQEEKRRELVSIRLQIHHQKQKISALEKEHEIIIKEAEEKKIKTINITLVRLYEQYLGFLKRRIAYEKDVLADMQKKEKEKLAEYIEARKNTRLLERLKERRFEQWQYEASREEQKFLDEIGSTLFLREQKNA